MHAEKNKVWPGFESLTLVCKGDGVNFRPSAKKT